MKNATLSFLLLLLACSLSAQHLGQKRWAVTASPVQAFTKKGEIQIGIEKADTERSAVEYNLGFRFKGSDAPGTEPYFEQQFVSSEVGTVNRGVALFLFLPIPVFENDDDWTEKTVRKEYYTTSNAFASVGYKYYLLPVNRGGTQGGLYFTPGIAMGRRGVSEYVFAEGQKGYVEVLDSEWSGSDPNPWGLALGTGFVGTVKVVQEDVYNFQRLEIKEYSKTYLEPHLKLGYQLPFGKNFALDLGGQLSVHGRLAQCMTGQGTALSANAKLAYWF